MLTAIFKNSIGLGSFTGSEGSRSLGGPRGLGICRGLGGLRFFKK